MIKTQNCKFSTVATKKTISFVSNIAIKKPILRRRKLIKKHEMIFEYLIFNKVFLIFFLIDVKNLKKDMMSG